MSAVDLDDTLWGGVVGEAGAAGIRLGEQSPGSEFVEFQRWLATLPARGILLAVASKNNEADALEDVLNLSKAMAYKAALAGLDLGGGKAVIIGDPARDKSEAMLRAYGRFVQSLNSWYRIA